MEINKNQQEYTPNYPVDLHCHSTRSDGADTPQQLINHAAELGMKVLAITDHDIRPPKEIIIENRPIPEGESLKGDLSTKEPSHQGNQEEDFTEETEGKTGPLLMDVAAYARSRGVQLLRGIEISCETTVEDCHIVCFGCDWEDAFFDELERAVAESKVSSYRELVRRLDTDGMRMTWEEVLENGGNPVREDQVQKKMIFELIARKGYQKDWSAAKLMVKNTPAYEILRDKPDPVEVIRQVHRCGGIAILAHPYLINEPVRLPEGATMDRAAYIDRLINEPVRLPEGVTMDRAAYIDRLINAGLDGIEACYSYAKTSYGGDMTPDQIEREVRSRYADRVAVISGGSDYHADFKKGVKPEKARNIGECGITMEYFTQNPLLQMILKKNT